MKQKYAVVILFCLICGSGLTSFGSYRATERVVTEDMTCALTKALAEQQSDFISTDTIRTFNSYLKMEQLRGHAVLAVTTRQEGLRCEAKPSSRCQTSDQHPSYGQWHCFGASTASGIIVSKCLSWHLAVWPILRLKVDSMMQWVSRSG